MSAVGVGFGRGDNVVPTYETVTNGCSVVKTDAFINISANTVADVGSTVGTFWVAGDVPTGVAVCDSVGRVTLDDGRVCGVLIIIVCIGLSGFNVTLALVIGVAVEFCDKMGGCFVGRREGVTFGRRGTEEFRCGTDKVAFATTGRRVGLARVGVLGFRVVAVPFSGRFVAVGRGLNGGRAVGRGLLVADGFFVGFKVGTTLAVVEFFAVVNATVDAAEPIVELRVELSTVSSRAGIDDGRDVASRVVNGNGVVAAATG